MRDEIPPVLLVEDNKSTQVLVKKLLSTYCDCEVAGGVREALRLAEKRSYELALIDINLGEERDGIFVLDTLQEMERWQEVPFVALTAYAFPRDRKRLIDAGFDDYLSKPFTKDELLQTVQNSIEA